MKYNDVEIRRNKNGFVNLADMCKANDKNIYSFIMQETNIKLLELLESRLEYPAVTSDFYGHLTIAIELSRCFSHEFAIWFDFNILEVDKIEYIPDDSKEKLKQLFELVDSGDFHLAGYLIEKLESTLGKNHPELTRANALIKFLNVKDPSYIKENVK